MSEQERIILQYLENSYTGARMLDDISAMTRIARAIEAFEADPTEDIFAVEPKKGKWVLTDYPDEQTYKCSVCNEIWTFIVGTPVDNGAFFCPNCGARMEE